MPELIICYMESEILHEKATFECGICLDLLSKPCTVACGHNFCQACLSDLQRATTFGAKCPLCRASLSSAPYQVNHVLEQVVKVLFPQDYIEKLQSVPVRSWKATVVTCVNILERTLRIAAPVLVALCVALWLRKRVGALFICIANGNRGVRRNLPALTPLPLKLLWHLLRVLTRLVEAWSHFEALCSSEL